MKTLEEEVQVRIRNLIESEQFNEAYAKIKHYSIQGYNVLDVQKDYIKKLMDYTHSIEGKHD